MMAVAETASAAWVVVATEWVEEEEARVSAAEAAKLGAAVALWPQHASCIAPVAWEWARVVMGAAMQLPAVVEHGAEATAEAVSALVTTCEM